MESGTKQSARKREKFTPSSKGLDLAGGVRLALSPACVVLSSESDILPLKTATREKCSKVKASNSFLKRFDIWVRASQAILVWVVLVLDVGWQACRAILNPKILLGLLSSHGPYTGCLETLKP